MTVTVDYKQLQEAAKLLNDACGTSIKVIGGKKDDLISAISEAVENGFDGIPESVLLFYNNCIKLYKDSPESIKVAQTKLGNTYEILKEHARVLEIDSNEKLSLIGLEELIFNKLDSLSQEEWDALPESTRVWDCDMGEAVKALAKKTDERVGDSPKSKKAKNKASDNSSEDDKPKKEKKKKAKPKHGPRPDFKFNEGTNAYQIMQVFDRLFEKSKGEGLKTKDIQDACEQSDVKSSNVRGRVSGVLKYASLPEGGEQVFKHKNLWYKAGAPVPEEN